MVTGLVEPTNIHKSRKQGDIRNMILEVNSPLRYPVDQIGKDVVEGHECRNVGGQYLKELGLDK